MLLCTQFVLPEAKAQAGWQSAPGRESEVNDLIIGPTATQSSPAPLTASPAMPPFKRSMLTPSEQLIERAKGLLGIPYKFAGNSPDTGFDCSGLVRFVFRDVLGISLPGRAEEIGRGGEKLSDSNLSPGDLVFFNTLNRPLSHVGIYLGNRQFLHAPASGGVVRIESMTLPYWTKRYQGARRIVNDESRVSTVAGVTPELAHGVEIHGGGNLRPGTGPEFAPNAPALGNANDDPKQNPNTGGSAGTSGNLPGNSAGAANKRGKPGDARTQDKGPEQTGEAAKATESLRSSESKSKDSGKNSDQQKNPDQLDLFLKKLKEKP